MFPVTLKRLWASWWLPEVSILWVFFFSRLWNTLALPAYIDEGSLLMRARNIERGLYVFDPLIRIGKWLQPAGTALFAPDGPESLWLARSTSALLAVLSCAACIALGRMLASRNVGRLAGAFYILPAMGFFHERSAVSDVWMVAFSALALALSVRLIQTRQARYALPLGLAMAAAVLSKISAAPLLGVPLLAALILAHGRQARRRGIVWSAVAIVVAAAIVLALYAIALDQQSPRQTQTTQAESILGSACDWSPICEGLDAAVTKAGDNFSNSTTYGLWLWVLVGPPMLALALASLALLPGLSGRGVGFLWSTLLVRLVPFIAVANWLPIRNFLMLMVPLAVLAALTVSRLWRLSWGKVVRPALRYGSGALVVGAASAALVWSVPLDASFVDHPQDTVVPPLDPYQCWNREHFSFAYGYPEVSQTLRDWMADDPRRTNVIAERERHMLSYWGPRVGDVEEWDGGGDNLRVKVALWLLGEESVFFVDELPTRPIPDEPFGASLETIAVHPIPCGDVSLRVRRLVSDSPELRRSMYEAAFPSPNEVAEQYRAIALHLIDTQAEGAVVVYPPNQFELLNNRLQWGTALDGMYVVGDMWPLDPQRVEESLAELAEEHGQLHVVLLGEEIGDPDHVIETWLNNNMQLTTEELFGPVRLLNYAPPA